jgi:hypothetical protein
MDSSFDLDKSRNGLLTDEEICSGQCEPERTDPGVPAPTLTSLVPTPPNDYPQPESLGNAPEFIWDADEPQARNFQKLGQRLAETGKLFRRPQHGNGLMLVLVPGRTAGYKNDNNRHAPGHLRT